MKLILLDSKYRPAPAVFIVVHRVPYQRMSDLLDAVKLCFGKRNYIRIAIRHEISHQGSVQLSLTDHIGNIESGLRLRCPRLASININAHIGHKGVGCVMYNAWTGAAVPFRIDDYNKIDVVDPDRDAVIMCYSSAITYPDQRIRLVASTADNMARIKKIIRSLQKANKNQFSMPLDGK